jgi:hypothetical protein
MLSSDPLSCDPRHTAQRNGFDNRQVEQVLPEIKQEYQEKDRSAIKSLLIPKTNAHIRITIFFRLNSLLIVYFLTLKKFVHIRNYFCLLYRSRICYSLQESLRMPTASGPRRTTA